MRKASIKFGCNQKHLD